MRISLVSAVAVVSIFAATACGDDAGSGDVGDISGVVVVEVGTAVHVGGSEVDYPTSPAAGGDHFDVWQTCGLYSVELIEAVAVHSLEHGAVWITWTADASAADLSVVEDLVADESHFLASPYPGQSAPFVLTAWGRQLELQAIEEPRARQFIATYAGRVSPTAPEPGVTCESGVGVAPDDPTANYAEILAEIESQ